MQIGLGSDVASISANISTNGGTQRTERNLDLMINGSAFFIVESGGEKFFTRSGALGVDVNGTLYNTSNGATVLGWQADAEGNIIKDNVSALSVMSADKMSSQPTATTRAVMTGNIDQNDEQVAYNDTSDGYPVTISFYDNIGNSYLAKLYLMQTGADVNNMYTVSMGDLTDSSGNSVLYTVTTDGAGNKVYTSTEHYVALGGDEYTYTVDPATGEITWTPEVSSTVLAFNGSNGEFQSVTADGEAGDTVVLKFNNGDEATNANNPFPEIGITIDFHNLTMYSAGGSSKASAVRGDEEGKGSGNTAGTLSGFTIQSDGKIYGVYSNGDKMVFGQIALATFANPAGLESVGNSLYRESLNSGEFDGIGIDPSTVNGFTTGALEMSNVDLANEFTTMITTQRGFQANSRIITTSDTLLEEIVNLKR